MLRTYQPKRETEKKEHGFRKRMKLPMEERFLKEDVLRQK